MRMVSAAEPISVAMRAISPRRDAPACFLYSSFSSDFLIFALFRRVVSDASGTSPVCNMSFHWLVLLAAIAVEIFATAALKSAVSAPALLALLPLLLIGVSFALLSIALRVIPMAVAYAVWEGLGIAGIALIGHLLFGEHLTATRLLALGAIILGIVLLERGVGGPASPARAAGRVG